MEPALTTPPNLPPALVFASGLNGLCTVRSLGVSGIPVWAIVTDLSQPCVRSRLARGFLRRPGESVLEVLDRLRQEHGVSAGVCIATTDDGAAELAAVAPGLPPCFHFAGPSSGIATLLRDKRSELEALAAITDCLPPSLIEVPRAPDAVMAALRFPIIMKPRTQRLANAVRMKNRVVHTRAELAAFLEEFEDALDHFVAQEVIPGDDASIWQCNAVFDREHALVSAFTFQKLGMSPPHYGVTTMGRSVRNDDVIELAGAIGKALRYVGPAGFEFKRDSRDGRYCYIEINPRHGMSNWFDTCCGVNSAWFTYMVALGRAPEASNPSQTARTFLDLNADFVSRVIDDRESLLSVGRRYAALVFTRRVGAYWWWRDPAPGLSVFRRNLVRDVSRLARALKRRVGLVPPSSHPGR